ncbi:MAG TPA: glycogen/starch synthase, partial [Sulfuricaulis sp.]|nr:glycogen/starch synthase [Sulfuricaulis sp.]
MPKILFVASEAHPLIKTGGLGDIVGSLPVALASLKTDIRLLLPAYRDAVARAEKLSPVAELHVSGIPEPVRLLEGRLPGTQLITWFVEYPPAFGRVGNPYLDSHGLPWIDNASRFALFARAVVPLALGRAGLSWRPDLVHCHDWQTGLVPALLAQEKNRPASIFTIHNLSYQGLFPYRTFTEL